MKEHPLVLFDGECNYCNSMVNFSIKNDPEGKLRFAPLQGSAGQKMRLQYRIDASVDSVLFIDNGKAYTYSDAALRIAKYLRWPAKAFSLLVVVPSFIRQPIYRWIARNRYKWFGKRDACMMPGPEVRERFID